MPDPTRLETFTQALGLPPLAVAPASTTGTAQIPAEVPPATTCQEEDAEVDFQTARANLTDAAELGKEGLQELSELAKSSEHPRAYEVLATLLRSVVEANRELVNIHKTKRECTVPAKETPQGSVTNQQTNLFVGSTAELQALLAGRKNPPTHPVVNVTPPL